MFLFIRLNRLHSSSIDVYLYIGIYISTWQRYVVAKSLCERNPVLMRLSILLFIYRHIDVYRCIYILGNTHRLPG